jgi:hypothetical protein
MRSRDGLAVRAGLLITTLTGAFSGGCPKDATKMTAMHAAPSGFDLPKVHVEGEPRYLLGFPLVVAVTFDNSGSKVEFYSLPELDLAFSRGPLSLRLEPLRGGTLLVTQASPIDEDRMGMALAAGERRRMLLDLSNLASGLQPGRYQLTVSLRDQDYVRASDPVEVEFVVPSPTDATEATRLRRLGEAPLDTGAWAPFLLRNWNTVDVSPNLSAEARAQLALHLFLHRAIYGPQPIARLDPAPLRALRSPVVVPEARVLEYEALCARDGVSAHATVATSIRQQWSGLAFRVERVARGEGFLTAARHAFGAEQEFLRPPTTYPYKP